MVEVGGGCKRHHLERDGPELALVRRTNVVWSDVQHVRQKSARGERVAVVREYERVHASSGLGVVLALEHSGRLRRHDLRAVRARVEFFHPQPPNRPRPDALNGKAAATAIALSVWSGVELALDSTDGALYRLDG